jgi:single-stranded DNA-binding protein
MPAAAVSWSRAACRAMVKLARSGLVPGQVSTASTMARGTAETLTKGSRVIVQGRLRQRSFETREGEKRTVIGLEVDDVDPSLREVDPSLR